MECSHETFYCQEEKSSDKAALAPLDKCRVEDASTAAAAPLPRGLSPPPAAAPGRPTPEPSTTPCE